jgi:diguanylate cyclase (GGDEF)-like protein
MHHINVAELMSRTLHTVSVDVKLAEVVRTMHMNHVSCLVVVADKRQPVGIVTERDLVRVLDEIFSGRKSQYLSVAEIMTSPLLTIRENANIFDALVLCRSHQIRHLPVVDEAGSLCGLLTYTDLAKAYELAVQEGRTIIDNEVRDKTLELREANERLKALSMEDPLLGIGNRRSMDIDLTYTHNLAVRYQRPYSVVLFDVDWFKSYNDHYGHQAGDNALKTIAQHIRSWNRKADRLYRYGGEELLLLLPETELPAAIMLATRIVQELAERKIPHVKSQFHLLTVSAGVGAPDLTRECGWEAVVNEADEGLYMAKGNGRNQVYVPARITASQ